MLGTTLCGRYTIVRHLGGGGFSQTFLAEDRQLPGNPLCVVKQLKPKSTDPFTLQTASRLFDREAEVLYRLGNHPQIPRLLAHLEQEQEFYLVQEFIEGNELKQELRAGNPSSELYVITLLQEILKILEFVHEQNVIHRDIKPSNLIRRKQDGKIVLIDFGAVKQVSTQKANSDDPTILTIAIGSPGYMANEQLAGKPLFCSDVYAAGMVGIQALTGLPPNQLPQDIRTSEIMWRTLLLPKQLPKELQQVSSELAEVLDKMVRYDYRQRYQSATEVLEALEQLVSNSTIVMNYASIAVKRSHSTAQSTTKTWTSPPQVSSPLDIPLEPNQPSVALTQTFTSEQQTPPHCPANPSVFPLDAQTSATWMVEETTAGLSPFDEIVNYLEQHENTTRIKKLIFCACTDQWVNDLSILNNLKLQELLQTLIEANPTLEQFRAALHSIVQTLNRQEEYSLVAKVIIRQLKKIYNEPEDVPPKNFVDPTQPSSIIEEITAELEQDEESIRIKKLIFCTCTSRWENNLSILNNLRLQDLLQELSELNPTLNQLSSSLYNVVNTLNRKLEYSLIANKIVSKLGRIYSETEESSTITHTQTETTQKQFQVALNQSCENAKIPSFQGDLTRTYDPFVVRMEVMRYANPLRAKILGYSIVYHPFNYKSREDWSAIKDNSLDDLLFNIFCNYKTLAELEYKLYSTAKCLKESEESTQVATAIIQAMKPFYINS